MGANTARSGRAVVQHLRHMTIDDDALGAASLREDGQTLHPAYLFQVKKPSESRGPWDLYKLLATIPADQSFRPLSESQCPMVKS